MTFTELLDRRDAIKEELRDPEDNLPSPCRNILHSELLCIEADLNRMVEGERNVD